MNRKNIVKRKHIIRLFLICMFNLIIYIPNLYAIIHIAKIESDQKKYELVQATIVDMHYVARDVYVSTLKYKYNEQYFEKETSHNIKDYIGRQIPIAIDRKNGIIFRLEITVSYINISCMIGGICLFLIEFFRYNEEKKKFLLRKQNEKTG